VAWGIPPYRGTGPTRYATSRNTCQIAYGIPTRGRRGTVVNPVVHENHRSSISENDWLRDLFDDFVNTIQHGARFRIACFYEQLPTDLGLLLKGRVSCFMVTLDLSDSSAGQGNYTYEEGKHLILLVDERSACFDRATRLISQHPRACNHFALNKFSSSRVGDWEKLTKIMQLLQRSIQVDSGLQILLLIR
jgi:hypothetical protein